MTGHRERLRKAVSRAGDTDAVPQQEHCANCGIAIDEEDEQEPSGGGSISLDLGPGAAFCCDGCADGGPCSC